MLNFKQGDKVIHKYGTYDVGRVIHEFVCPRTYKDMVLVLFFKNLIPEVRTLKKGSVTVV